MLDLYREPPGSIVPRYFQPPYRAEEQAAFALQQKLSLISSSLPPGTTAHLLPRLQFQWRRIFRGHPDDCCRRRDKSLTENLCASSAPLHSEHDLGQDRNHFAPEGEIPGLWRYQPHCARGHAEADSVPRTLHPEQTGPGHGFRCRARPPAASECRRRSILTWRSAGDPRMAAT